MSDLVAKVKELQRADPQAKEQWGTYTTRHGQGTRDPSKHTAEFLQGFIDSYNSGAAASPWGGGGGDADGLVMKVKELQRADARAKEQWIAFTDLNGAGTRDPSKHPAEFLQGFLDHHASGHHIQPQAAAGLHEGMTLPEAFKALQKKSESFKNIWKEFCAQQGGGKFDPSKHDSAFHMCFLENVASLASGGPGASLPMGATSGMGMGMGAPPMKRMRDSSGMGMGTGGTGDPMKDALVNQVKAFQRMGTEQKELWCMYADTYLGGTRDPSRHDASVLQEFCVNHEVPAASPGAMRPAPAAAGGMGMGMGMGMSDPMKDGLVHRVKAYQKASRENAEIWGSFCGVTRDPGRHTVEKLQEFVTSFGVP